MKQRYFFIAVILFASGLLFGQNKIKLGEELVITKLSDTLFVATHYFPWESNSLVIKASDNDVVLIDTPFDSSSTLLLLKWINENFHSPKITAINTGYHIDNLGGNGCLRNEGINIYGSDLLLKLIDERGNKPEIESISSASLPEKYSNAYKNLVKVKPNKIYKISEGLNMAVGCLNFEVYYPGESHTRDNVTVYIKEINTLFGGCMIKSADSRNLGFTGDANITEWKKSVQKVFDKYPAVHLVIPHHGMWGNTILLKHTLELFN